MLDTILTWRLFKISHKNDKNRTRRQAIVWTEATGLFFFVEAISLPQVKIVNHVIVKFFNDVLSQRFGPRGPGKKRVQSQDIPNWSSRKKRNGAQVSNLRLAPSSTGTRWFSSPRDSCAHQIILSRSRNWYRVWWPHVVPNCHEGQAPIWKWHACLWRWRIQFKSTIHITTNICRPRRVASLLLGRIAGHHEEQQLRTVNMLRYELYRRPISRICHGSRAFSLACLLLCCVLSRSRASLRSCGCISTTVACVMEVTLI